MVSYEAELGQSWTIYQGDNTIGRLEATEGLDIEIDHPTTSSRHAVIRATARPGRMTLEDLGSTNGTFRGDTKVEPGMNVELADGDTIRFGGYTVTIKIV
jgi:pSer/pThr/pTyr-binding forkhead associated (FHA) protein